jgi:hypothetical protein
MVPRPRGQAQPSDDHGALWSCPPGTPAPVAIGPSPACMTPSISPGGDAWPSCHDHHISRAGPRCPPLRSPSSSGPCPTTQACLPLLVWVHSLAALSPVAPDWPACVGPPSTPSAALGTLTRLVCRLHVHVRPRTAFLFCIRVISTGIVHASHVIPNVPGATNENSLRINEVAPGATVPRQTHIINPVPPLAPQTSRATTRRLYGEGHIMSHNAGLN